jgi:hypothetical protein
VMSKGVCVDGHKVFVTDRARASLLTERYTGGVDIGVVVDAAAEGGALRKTDGVCQTITSYHIQALSIKQGNKLAHTSGQRWKPTRRVMNIKEKIV